MKLHRSFPFALLLLAATSIGCSASSHQRVPLPAQDVEVSSPDLARIYFVRVEGGDWHANSILVYDAEKEIGALSWDTFLCWERPGGRTLGRAWYQAIDPSKGQLEAVVDLDCPAGHAYYYGVRMIREGGKPEVVPLDVAEGRKIVADRKAAGS